MESLRLPVLAWRKSLANIAHLLEEANGRRVEW